MTIMLGVGKRGVMAKSKIAVGDTDSLIALVCKEDANHIKAKNISKWLLSQGYEVVYPNTAILETITTLKRALNLPDKAELVNTRYLQGTLSIEYIDEKIQKLASQRFSRTNSKKNTIFDAIVAETAVELGAEYIFSFDSWYSKEGFKLVVANLD
ncbi:MAG: Uncharacterized protein G01um10145_438 [Microgenomates group bacterium Gr01-1014_5]|nr:MAG: Uncharacterized protein G01um10145_438 [Microgenomates group bacterium Gr01-1014_5]